MLNKHLPFIELRTILDPTIHIGEGLDEIDGFEAWLDQRLKEIGGRKPVGEKKILGHGIVWGLGLIWGLKRPIRFGSNRIDSEMILEVVQELVANTTAGASSGGCGWPRRVKRIDLRALTPVHDLQTSHCCEYVVLHHQLR